MDVLNSGIIINGINRSYKSLVFTYLKSTLSLYNINKIDKS